MAKGTRKRFQLHVDLVKKRLQERPLAFALALSEELVRSVLAECEISFRERVYKPWITLWAFVSQMLSDDGSCQAAVCQVNAWRLQNGQRACAPDTGHYCAARSRLPVKFFQTLFARQVEAAQQETPEQWKWLGQHEVKVFDGTTMTMPDTPENRAAFPPDGETEPGTRFPIIRAVVVFSLSLGLLKDFAFGPYQGKGTGEISLLRKLWHCFNPGDVTLGDKYYCSYQDVWKLMTLGVHGVVKHIDSRTTLQEIKRLGKDDVLCEWQRPKYAHQKMTAAEFALLPERFPVRIVTVKVAVPGFRVQTFEILTTLLDAAVYTPEHLAELFFQRWRGEMFLDDIKTTLGMDVLRCKHPEMIHKELITGFLAYNTVRIQMAQAAECCNIPLQQISFKTTVTVLNTFDHLPSTHEVIATKLASIVHPKVGHRPNRSEPRAVKRKRKPYESLKKPRHTYKST